MTSPGEGLPIGTDESSSFYKEDMREVQDSQAARSNPGNLPQSSP